VRKVNVELQMILWGIWVVVINLCEAILERFKLVKKPLKCD
jgi:hypothetical protein